MSKPELSEAKDFVNNSPLSSKKFVAYIGASFMWKVLIGVGVWRHDDSGILDSTVLLTLIITGGCLDIGYIISQAALDNYTRVAALAMGGKKGTPTKDPPPEEEEGDPPTGPK